MRKKRRQQITQGQTFYVRGTKDTVFMSVSEMNKKSRERERRRPSKTPSFVLYLIFFGCCLYSKKSIALQSSFLGCFLRVKASLGTAPNETTFGEKGEKVKNIFYN